MEEQALELHTPPQELTHVSPRTINAITRRTRALVRELVTEEIEEGSIIGAEGIVTEQVLDAFRLVAGDFLPAAAYCLLDARRLFLRDGQLHHNQQALSNLRAIACEVIAIRLVARLERVSSIYRQVLTCRFVRVDVDGDLSRPTSALEMAIDQHAIYFLASPAVQNVVEGIWKGDLIQEYDEDGHSRFIAYLAKSDGSFVSHYNPARLSVPKYSYSISICIWIFFLFVFSVQSRTNKHFDTWEGITWFMALAYIIEDIFRWFKIGGIDAVTFWTVVDVATDSLFLIALGFRIAGFAVSNPATEAWCRQRSFEVLSAVAPLLWIQVTRVTDSFVYFGTLQVIILRMLKEFVLFATLLIVICIGFFHSLYALDAADENRHPDAATRIVRNLLDGLLGNSDLSDKTGATYVLYTLFIFIATVILLNVLVAFFSVAQSEVVESVMFTYHASFAEKVISLSRTPDEFVYLAPFNLLEAIFIAPFERIISRASYVKLNQTIQSIVFFVPLSVIAFYESRLARTLGAIILDPTPTEQEEAEADGIKGTIHDPDIPEDEPYQDFKISTVSFEDLIKKMKK